MYQAAIKTYILLLIALVAAPVAAQQQSKTVTSGARAYTINAGDDIEVYVWGEERLQRSIKVLPDGTFSFPLIGKVIAQGKLPKQIEEDISKGLETQYRGEVPQVTVSVSAPSGLQFSVIGKVAGPGTFTPGRYVNLLEALSMAGGASEFANLSKITIVRKTGQGLTHLKANLGDAMKGNFGSSDATVTIPQIESGDTVIVP